MKDELIKKAIDLSRRTGYFFLTTADTHGVAHLSIATKIRVSSPATVSVAGWLCPGTVANLETNPNIGVIVWDRKSDTGYQLIGKIKGLREVAVLDGYAGKKEERAPVPQVEREVAIHVEKVLDFKQSPHSDTEA